MLAQVSTAPDGISLDAEGCVWFADGFGQRLVRTKQGGEIIEEVKTDEPIFACMLGGNDGRTLFVCPAPSFAEEGRVPITGRACSLIRWTSVGRGYRNRLFRRLLVPVSDSLHDDRRFAGPARTWRWQCDITLSLNGDGRLGSVRARQGAGSARRLTGDDSRSSRVSRSPQYLAVVQ